MLATPNLHCGACQTDFDDISTLIEHIENCAAAGVLLICAYKSYSDEMGHPYSNALWSLHKAVPFIKQYAIAISNEIDNFNRSACHVRLCDSLNISYSDFRPFEATEIKTLPSFSEAEQIIWRGLGKVILLNILKATVGGNEVESDMKL